MREELDCYHAQIPTKFSSSYKIVDPLEWWKTHEDEFPRLAMLARRYLCVMATSVSCERIFSTSGWIVNKRRCSLSDERISTLMLIRCNRQHTNAGD